METAEAEESGIDICRVCRMEGSVDRPLFYPCVCTGSIKYIHQECLLQWLKYSKKEYCELCNHKYKFQPIYHPDMPTRLPVQDLLNGVGRNVLKAIRCWIHYTVVAVAWLGIVPLTASRIYQSLFTGSVSSLLTLPLDLISTENIFTDCLHGIFIIVLSLCAFIALVWLREQIIHGGPAHWLELDPADPQHQEVAEVEIENNQQENNNLQENAGGHNLEGGNIDNQGNGGVQVDQNMQGNVGAANQQPPQQQEDNWQPFEWDRAADDLTWERLLGLDGSLVFLEHVFWVISLNTLFMLVFVFSPYHVGHFAVRSLGWISYFRASYFEGLLTTVFGYFIICSGVYLVHKVAKIFKLKRAHRTMGMCYLALKVFLLILMEIGFFPLVCGWWLDICSLSLFHSTLRDRCQSFLAAPGTSMFVHWLVGMVYVFYFASFILLLREVLRPGVLWFLRNLNDPEFNPIQEMIQFPVYRHVRRFVASLIIFAVTILLLVYCPIKIIQQHLPTILPYNISLNAETPLSELSLELLLLQVVLPALLEQSHARQALKGLVKCWCLTVGSLLDLKEYLLPAEEVSEDENGVVENEAVGGEAPAVGVEAPAQPAPPFHHLNLGLEHQALLLVREPVGFQSYRKPKYFSLRICALLLILSVSALVSSVVCFALPVSLGRWSIRLLGDHGSKKTHELYTVAAGLYICWTILRFGALLKDWMPRGWRTVAVGVKSWVVVFLKCLLAAFALIGAIPFLMGLLFQLVIVAPMRVSLHQSSLFFPWQDWAMGILHCKIVCAGIMMGPDWWMKQVFERLYQDGFRNMNVKYLYVNLVFPVVACLGSAIAVPYAFSHSILCCFGASLEDEILFQRHIYPCLLLLLVAGSFLGWQFQQVSGLVVRIRNEKYLVGQRLVNYEPGRKK